MGIPKNLFLVVALVACVVRAQGPEALKDLGKELRASFLLDGIDAEGSKAPGITAAGPVAGICSDAVKPVKDANGIGALRFDGKDARIDLGNPKALDFAGNISVSVWMRPARADEFKGLHSIFMHGQSTDPAKETGMRISDGEYVFGSWQKDKPPAVVGVAMPEIDKSGMTWVHLVGVCEGTKWSLYRNGTLAKSNVAEFDGGALTMAEGWTVGARGSSDSFFKGDISGLTVWSRALTEAEVGGLFKLGRNAMKVAGAPGLSKEVPALVATAKDAAPDPIDLFKKFKEPAAWETKPDDFIKDTAPYGFQFLDAQHMSVSSADKLRLSFLGRQVYEARVTFSPTGVKRVELSLYNKGDAEKKLDQTKFESELAGVRSKMTEIYGAGTVGKKERPRPNFAIERFQWSRQNPGVQLEWAYVDGHRDAGKDIPYSAEYINVVMVPMTGMAAKDNAALTGNSMLVKAKTTAQLRTNVKRESDGDVWIDGIPMVDQGQKGYCAAAASESILRYFGLNVNEHQIAQLAGTSAAGGTSLLAMSQAAEKIGRNYQLDKRDLIKVEDGKDFLKSDLYKQIEQYNAVVKKAKNTEATVVDWHDYVGQDRSIDIQRIWAAMDPQMLLTSRMKQKQAYAAFLKDVKQCVDSGVPILWSCIVGMYPETPAIAQPGAFGHMRLIIGYNAAKHTIIYFDTWGAAHARKTMPDDQAWTMTKGMLILKPRL